MTDSDSAAATAAPDMEAPASGDRDGRVAAVRQQRDVALRTGDSETAQEFDALERELYEAEAENGRTEPAPADDVEAPMFTEADHSPLSRDEAAGVFAFLDEVDPEAAVSLRAEWGGDAAANLGYAHLWFTTQYTQDERDSMVVTPGLVRMAARMGRTLAADRRAAGRHQRTRGRDTMTDGAGSLHEQAGDIRRRREEALRAGDHRLAQRFDEEERALYARMHGGAPIVGHAGRTL